MGSVIVLDLDETLIYAFSKEESIAKKDSVLWNAICNAAAHKCEEIGLKYLQTENHFIFLRPHVVPFLQFCRDGFAILVIFTAANQSHAQNVYKELFQKLANIKVDFLLHRDNCGKFQTATSSTNSTTLVPFQKNLCHLREVVESSATAEQLSLLRWEDCIFVDDFSLHAVNNCGETLLVPKFDFPCLREMLSLNIAGIDKVLLEEACDDRTLFTLMQFICTKVSIEPRICWHNLDKRFAMFTKK